MPLCNGDLRGKDGRANLSSVINEVEEILDVGLRELHERSVIQNEDMDFGKGCEQTREPAIWACKCEFRKETGLLCIEC